ncbi:hypothetical protein ABT117_39115 [Streptomyces sp. NPDC002262]|uniref:hypothetical protein n=1 Tax=Streptomyces sp. NPDC002262 TaxID=3154414 RepID=UPI00332BD354
MAVATLYALAVAVLPVSTLVGDRSAAIIRLAAIATVVATVFVLRRLTSEQASLPAEALDDLMAQLRYRYRSTAQQILAAACALAFVVLIWQTADHQVVDAEIVHAVAWPLLALAFDLPTVICAVALPDAQEDQ